jgi:hypothetical protein
LKDIKEKKINENAVKDTIGDPAFYNDQIGENKDPMRKNMKDLESKKGSKCGK